MDSEALKIILNLHRENIMLKRAISDAIIMLELKREHFILDYDIGGDAIALFSSIGEILSLLNQQEQPNSQPN